MPTPPRTRLPRIALFLAITFAFSWTQWLAVIAAQHGLIPFRVALTALAIFGPLVGALAVMRSREEWRSIFNWRIPTLIVLTACLLPPLLFAASLAAATALVPIAAPISFPSLSTIATVSLGMFITAGLGEEPGWRGFLLPELRKSLSAIAASAIVALTWFAWHLPLFWVAGSSQSDMPLAAFALGLASYTFIITWLVEASSNTTLAAMLFHASANVTFWLAMVTLKGTPQETFVIGTYVGGLVTVAILSLFKCDRGLQRYKETVASESAATQSSRRRHRKR